MKRCAVALLAVLLVATGCGGDDGDEADDPTTTTSPAESTAATVADAEPDGPVVPGEEWVVSTPEEHDIDPAGLETARRYAFQPGQNTQGVVVVKDGEIVAEWYADGADADSWAASWSMAKSFTSAVVGIAIDDGAIAGVDEPVATYLPGWAGTDHAAVTVEDLLQMESGLGWNEDYEGDGTQNGVVAMVTGQADQLAYVEASPQSVDPGTVWSYSSGDTMLLSGVVQEATGQPLDEYATEVLLDPIGMQQVEWWRDVAGHTLGYCCVDTTTREFARLGLLYARGGRWGDEQVVPEQWVEDSLTPTEESGGAYGYQWWLGDMEGVSDDLFIASGHDDQNIYVVPGLDLVVVRSGTYVKDPGEPVADPTLFSKYPSGGIVPGHGTTPADDWDDTTFLAPIVAAVAG